MTMVIDSSVALKWLYEENGSDRALELYTDILNGKTVLSAPRILLYEVGNVVRYKKPFVKEKLKEVKTIFENTPATYVYFSFTDWEEIISLAYEYDLSFYDNSYVYLAQKLHTSLITADKKLYEKTKKLGFVKLL